MALSLYCNTYGQFDLQLVEKNIPICPAVHFLSEHGFSCPLFWNRDGRAGISKQSMGARNRVGIGLSYRPARVGILSPAMGQGIDSRNRVWNWVAKLHRLACRYVNPMPTWFLAPIAGLKLPALHWLHKLAGIHSLESIPGLYKRLKIRALRLVQEYQKRP